MASGFQGAYGGTMSYPLNVLLYVRIVSTRS
jgi:hypothetical protein